MPDNDEEDSNCGITFRSSVCAQEPEGSTSESDWLSQALGQSATWNNEVTACEVLAARIADGALDDAPIWTDLHAFDGKPWRGPAGPGPRSDANSIRDSSSG